MIAIRAPGSFYFPLSQSTCCTAIAACVSQGDSPFSCKIWTLQFVDLFVVQPVDVNLELRKNFNNSNYMATMTNLHILWHYLFPAAQGL
jgi:hypothetical protein